MNNTFNISTLSDLYKSENYIEVIKICKKKIDKGPIDWQIYNYLAASLFAINKKEESLKYYKKAVDLNKENPELNNNLGAIFKSLGKFKEATEYFNKALKINNNYSDAKLNLASVLTETGEISKSISIFKELLSEDKNNYLALNNIGNAYRLNQLYDEAIENLVLSINIKPMPITYNNLGIAYAEKKEFNKALDNFKKAISMDKGFFDAYNNINELLLETNQINTSVKFTKNIIENFPDHYLPYFNHALSLSKIGKADEAIIYYKKSLNKNKLHEKTYNNLAVIYTNLHRIDQAVSLYKEAEELNISNIELKYNYASLLSKLGKKDDCDKIIRDGLRGNPDFYLFYDVLSHIKKYTIKDNDYISMVDLYNKLEKTDPGKSHLAFNIGKALENMSLFDEAALYFRDANTNKNDSITFKISKSIKQFDTIKTLFNEEFIKTHKNQGFKEEENIFIIGMPRSGSSLIEQILSTHTEVEGLGELRTMTDVINKSNTNLKESKIIENISSLKDISSSYFYEIGKSYNKEIHKLFKPKKRFSDKALMFDRIGWIKLALPKAKIIYCKRNPNDQLLSIYKNYFLDDFHGYSYNVNNLLTYYKGYLDIMEYWKNIFKEDILEIKYEEIIENPEVNVKKILKYCNLDWQKECLSFYKSNRYVNTISANDVRKPLYNSSIDAWKNYEKSLEPLFNKF